MSKFITHEDLKPYFNEATPQHKLISLAREINHMAKQTLQIIAHQENKRNEYDKLKKAKNKIIAAQEALLQAKGGFSDELFNTLIYDQNKTLTIKNKFKEARSKKSKQALVEAQQLHNNTFFNLCAQIAICIPTEKPKSIKKNELEKLIEIIHLYCEKIDPTIGWYSCSTYTDTNTFYGNFFLICKIIFKKMNMDIDDRLIVKYMQLKAKPSREKQQKLSESQKS